MLEIYNEHYKIIIHLAKSRFLWIFLENLITIIRKLFFFKYFIQNLGESYLLLPFSLVFFFLKILLLLFIYLFIYLKKKEQQ